MVGKNILEQGIDGATDYDILNMMLLQKVDLGTRINKSGFMCETRQSHYTLKLLHDELAERGANDRIMFQDEMQRVDELLNIVLKQYGKDDLDIEQDNIH